MSKKLSRRQFLQIAGVTTLAGVFVACSKPAADPTQAPAETVVLDYYWVGNADTDQRPLLEAAIG